MSTTTTSILSDLHHEVRGSGPPVVFIPGAGGLADHFADSAGLLADEFTTVTYDRRGCSRSAPLPDGERMSIAAQADDGAALVSELGLAPAIAFGTSAGGDILLELVARHPDVLRAAIVHEPALITLAEEHETGMARLGPIIERAAADPRGAMEAFIRTVAGDETFEDADPIMRERMLDGATHFFTAELESIVTYAADVETIRESGVTVRLLAGTEEPPEGAPQELPITRRLGHRLAVGVERLTGHHAPYLQHPETFADELRPVLREVATSQADA